MEDGLKAESTSEVEATNGQPILDEQTQEPSQELVQEMAEELAQEPVEEPVAEPELPVVEPEPEQELPQGQMQDLVQEIVQEPVQNAMIQEPVQEKTQETAEPQVVIPNSEQKPVQEKGQVAKKKKSSGGIIALVAVLSFALGCIVTLLVLHLMGTVQLQNLFNFGSVSFLGQKGEEASGNSVVEKEKQEDLVAQDNIKKVSVALKQYMTDHSGDLPAIKTIADAECLNSGGKIIACEEFQFPAEVGVDSESEVKNFYRDYLGQLMQMGDKVALNFYADLSAESEKEHYSGWSQANVKVFYNAFCQSEKKVLQGNGGFAVIVADAAEESYFCVD